MDKSPYLTDSMQLPDDLAAVIDSDDEPSPEMMPRLAARLAECCEKVRAARNEFVDSLLGALCDVP